MRLPTFKDWLKQQTAKGDPVGDFARDWLADPEAPEAKTADDVLDHIGVDRGGTVLGAAAIAWTFYRTELRYLNAGQNP